MLDGVGIHGNSSTDIRTYLLQWRKVAVAGSSSHREVMSPVKKRQVLFISGSWLGNNAVG